MAEPSVTRVLDLLEDALHEQSWVASTRRMIGGGTVSVTMRDGSIVVFGAMEITAPAAASGEAT